MRIYFDNCAYNRPYDDLSNWEVNLEAQTKIKIQEMVRSGDYELVTSEMSLYELDNGPDATRKANIRAYMEEYSSVHVGPKRNGEVQSLAREIMNVGVKYKDACHAASALIADCDYLISTDYRFIKRFRSYRTEKLRAVTPQIFCDEMEARKYE